MEYDANWQSRYADLIASPKQALSHVRPGQRVFVGTGCGEPVELATRSAAAVMRGDGDGEMKGMEWTSRWGNGSRSR